ncbi:hypothetical protein [Myxosarcina sp. GI1(2024)]
MGNQTDLILFHYDLELKPSKTQIVHSQLELDKHQAGFDFLGFNIRQYKVGKYQLHKYCHLSKTKSNQLIIKLHKAKKEGNKTQKWFNNLDWEWVDDIPTLLKVGT